MLHYIVSASTDRNLRDTNQDSLNVKRMTVCGEPVVFGVLCDGMGGLKKGELASATVMKRFHEWSVQKLPGLLAGELDEYQLRLQWMELISRSNTQLMQYGRRTGIVLGTTLVAILMVRGRYYLIHVGDSRAYELGDCLRQLTRDQTVVSREVELGRLTWEQAKEDPRRHILLQCIGASKHVEPAYQWGQVKKNALYMLCSDGLRNEILEEEIFEMLQPLGLSTQEEMKQRELALIELNKQRNEKDNISLITIRVY